MGRPKGIPSHKKGKEFVVKIYTNCLYCKKKIKSYPLYIKKFCCRVCYNKYKIGKKRPNHSRIMVEKHKIKQFGYKKGEQKGNKNPMSKPEIRLKQKQNVKRGKENYFAKHIFNKEKNHNWKGGISFIPYTLDWTETLRRSIRERDKYICQICYDYGNTIHHIDYIKVNCNVNNLICLCLKCHSKTGFNRTHWKNYLLKLTELKNGKK